MPASLARSRYKAFCCEPGGWLLLRAIGLIVLPLGAVVGFFLTVAERLAPFVPQFKGQLPSTRTP